MWYSDSVSFAVGEKVLVALYRPDGGMSITTGGDMHAGNSKYVISSDGSVKHSWRSEALTLEQLKDMVASAIAR